MNCGAIPRWRSAAAPKRERITTSTPSEASGIADSTARCLRLPHHLPDLRRGVLAHQRVGGAQHALNGLEHVVAAAPVLADDAGVAAAEDFVQDVHAENEVIEVSHRPKKRLREEIKRHHEVSHSAAEKDLVLAVDTRVGGQTPQENKDVG